MLKKFPVIEHGQSLKWARLLVLIVLALALTVLKASRVLAAGSLCPLLYSSDPLTKLTLGREIMPAQKSSGPVSVAAESKEKRDQSPTLGSSTSAPSRVGLNDGLTVYSKENFLFPAERSLNANAMKESDLNQTFTIVVKAITNDFKTKVTNIWASGPLENPKIHIEYQPWGSKENDSTWFREISVRELNTFLARKNLPKIIVDSTVDPNGQRKAEYRRPGQNLRVDTQEGWDQNLTRTSPVDPEVVKNLAEVYSNFGRLQQVTRWELGTQTSLYQFDFTPPNGNITDSPEIRTYYISENDLEHELDMKEKNISLYSGKKTIFDYDSMGPNDLGNEKYFTLGVFNKLSEVVSKINEKTNAGWTLKKIETAGEETFPSNDNVFLYFEGKMRSSNGSTLPLTYTKVYTLEFLNQTAAQLYHEMFMPNLSGRDHVLELMGLGAN